jgi:heme o synthase
MKATLQTIDTPAPLAKTPAVDKSLASVLSELFKMRLTTLVLLTTLVGFYLGSRRPVAWVLMFNTLFGTALLASGAAALNQLFEREHDGKMRRTQDRPLPAGRLDAWKALVFAILISLAGFAELWVGANALAALLGLFTLLCYLFVYTPMKQRSPHSTTIGSIPGAMPPLIGFAAASGTLTWDAWVLFAILFLWQFPHFYAIAWMYKEDYARAGIRMLPVVEPDGKSTARRILLYSIALIPITLMPKFFAMAGNVYLFGALALGLAFLYAGLRIRWDRTRQQARRVLLASVVYLPVLFSLMLFDRPA